MQASRVATALLAAAVAGGCVERTDGPTIITPPDPDTVVRVVKGAFPLQTGYPSDIEIVDQPGISDIAFVYDGTVVQAVQLGAGTLSTPAGVSGYTLTTASVFGDDLVILTPHRGLATASAGDSGSGSPTAVVELFNPTTGSTLQVLNVALSHTFAGGQNDTQGNSAGTITQGNVSGVCFVPTTGTQGKLYVSMSNTLSAFPTFDLYPGTVEVFNVDWSNATPVSTTPSTVLVTTGYNPTHVTPFSDPVSGRRYVLVGLTGQYQFGSGTVNTPSSIDVIDTTTDGVVTNIPLGNAVIGFQDIALRTAFNSGSGAVETFGCIGSALYGNVYQVNLTAIDALNQTASLPGSYTAGVVNDVTNPIVIGASSDFIVDVEAAAGGRYLFASSFNSGDIRIIDFSGGAPSTNVAPGPFVIGDPANSVSAGTFELRPGNFAGPEIFGLTGSFPGPDAVASVQTSLKVSAP